MTETRDADEEGPLFEDFGSIRDDLTATRIRRTLGPFGELSGILDEHGNLDPDKIRRNILPPITSIDDL